MSAVKLLAGFILGLIACAILLALVSIRMPITIENAEGRLVPATGEAVTIVASSEKNTEQNENELAGDDITEAVAEEIEEQTETANQETETVGEETSELAENSQDEDATKDGEEGAVAQAAETANVEEQTAADETEQSDAVVEETTTSEEETTELAALGTEGGNTISRLQVGQSSLLTDRNQGNRLRLNSDPDLEEPKLEPEAETPQPIGAFAQNSIEFAPQGKPLVAIILIDIGSQGVSQTDLMQLPFPITFALRSSRSNLTLAQEDYHTAGFEVVAMTSERETKRLIDGNEKGAEVENLTSITLARMPKALGLIDDPTARLQKDRASFLPLLSAMSETGHGFFSYNIGINSTKAAATELGMPSAIVARVLDANDEDIGTIKSYLSNAAFTAQRDGAVIVLGSTSQTTVDAIKEWKDSNSGASVSLATLSAATAFQR